MHNHDCTFLGLHKWHNHMFEHLGWMAMAHRYNSQLKIEAFLDGINRLKECLERKLHKTHDSDRKDDLRVLIDNTICLKACAHELVKDDVQQDKDKDNTKCIGKNGHEATNCGLAHWMRKKFEKLGWVCLAKSHGHELKARAYMDSIQKLKASLEMKINDVHEADRKDDLKILVDDVCILQTAAHKLLSNEAHWEHMYKQLSHKSSSSSHGKHGKHGKHTKKTYRHH